MKIVVQLMPYKAENCLFSLKFNKYTHICSLKYKDISDIYPYINTTNEYRCCKDNNERCPFLTQEKQYTGEV